MSETPPPETEKQSMLSMTKDGAKSVLIGLGGVATGVVKNSIEVTGAVSNATTSIAKNAVGTTAELTGSALSIVAKSGEMANAITNIGVIAAQQSSDHLGNTVGEGAKSLSIIAQTANTILSVVKSIAERTDNAIKAANERRLTLNKQKTEILEKSKDDNVKQETSKNILILEAKTKKLESQIKTEQAKNDATSKIEILKQEMNVNEAITKIEKDKASSNAILESELNKIELERQKNESDAKKLKDDFEKAQEIYNAKNIEAKKDIYIAMNKYGYMDKSMNNKGWAKGPFLPFYGNYGVFYKIAKITDDNNTSYIVDFDFPNGLVDSANKVGYYVSNDEEPTKKYYLNIRNLFGTTISGKLIQDTERKYLDEQSSYRIDVEKVWFKLPPRISGGKKTCRDRRRKRNRKTNRRIKKY